MKKLAIALALATAWIATPASAVVFNFTFDTTSTLLGGPTQTIRGTFTTSEIAVDQFGQTGLEITGISGTIFGAANSPALARTVI